MTRVNTVVGPHNYAEMPQLQRILTEAAVADPGQGHGRQPSSILMLVLTTAVDKNGSWYG